MKIIQMIRDFFVEKDFLEVETPVLVKLPGMEPNLDPVKTAVIDIHGNNYDGYLITSPEYAMKELLSVGTGDIFQICKCFRDREIWGGRHNVEFTMIEWYRVGKNYDAIIKDVCDLIHTLAIKLFGSSKIIYQNKSIDFDIVENITMTSAFLKYSGRDLDKLFDESVMREACIKAGYISQESNDSWDDMFYRIFLNEVEPYLGCEHITVLKDYPISQAALARPKIDDVRFAERFEIYCGGMELCNGFSELIDPIEQRKRLEYERLERKSMNKLDYPVDEVFLKALEDGLPECAGVALGVDRLIMLLLDAGRIEDVLLFPTADLFSDKIM